MPLLALAWLVFALAVTLSPVPDMVGPAEGMDPFCVVCGDRGLADLLLNVAFFVPLGWSVARARGWRWGVAAGVAVTVGIEALQLVIPGRFATLGDLLANGTGATLGAGVAGREARLLPVAAVGALIGVLAPLLLLAPAAPEGVYYGQWTARFGNMAHYEGRVIEASVGGIATPSWRSERSTELREALERDGPVDVTFVAGPRPPSLAPVFSVFDGRRRRIFLLGIDGGDVVVHRWTVATTLRLDTPALRWPGAMRGATVGDTVRMRFARGDDAPCLNVNGRTECDTAIGAGAGWTLLLSPEGLTPAQHRTAGILWMLVLGALIGAAPWRPRTRMTLLGVVTALVVALPWTLPYLSTTVLPGAALLAGGLTGLLTRRRALGA